MLAPERCLRIAPCVKVWMCLLGKTLGKEHSRRVNALRHMVTNGMKRKGQEPRRNGKQKKIGVWFAVSELAKGETDVLITQNACKRKIQ